MNSINKLIVTYHTCEVGELLMSPDKRNCVFQYSKDWLKNGF